VLLASGAVVVACADVVVVSATVTEVVVGSVVVGVHDADIANATATTIALLIPAGVTN